MQGSVLYLEIGDDPAEGVEDGIEDEGLQGSFRIPFRSGDLLHDGIQDGLYALPRAGGDAEDVVQVAADEVHDLIRHHIRLRGVHIYLIEDGDDFEPVVYGLVEVGDGLGLDALGRIHHQQRTLAGSDGTGDFVAEVHVAGSVDKIEDVALVLHLDCVALDSNALLALQIHIVQHLSLHIALAQRLRQFKQTVGKGGLTVIDVCDNAEIAYSVHCHSLQS